MKYLIERPINGISINGNKYLLDNNNELVEFSDYDKCLDFIKENITDEEPEGFIWEEENE